MAGLDQEERQIEATWAVCRLEFTKTGTFPGQPVQLQRQQLIQAALPSLIRLQSPEAVRHKWAVVVAAAPEEKRLRSPEPPKVPPMVGTPVRNRLWSPEPPKVPPPQACAPPPAAQALYHLRQRTFP